jgi:hypothetical protein
MKRILKFLILSFGVLANWGCLYRMLQPPPPPAPPETRAAWTHEMPSTVALAPLPLSENRVAVLAAKGTLRVLSAEDGSVLAEDRLPFEPLAAAGGACDVLAGGKGHLLLWCADDGKIAWHLRFEGETPVPVARADMGAAPSRWVALTSGAVHLLDRNTGARRELTLDALQAAPHRWRGRPAGVPSAFTGAALLAGEVLYAGATDGLYAIHLGRERILWKRYIGGAVQAPPLLEKKMLYVGASDKRLYALGAKKGKMRWNLLTGGKIRAPFIHHTGPRGETLYAASYDLILYALRAHGGHRLWNADLPMRVDDMLYWPEADALMVRPLFSPEILLLNPHSGGPSGVFALPAAEEGEDDDYFTSSMTRVGEKIFVGTYQGRVYTITTSPPESDQQENMAGQ